MRSIITLVACGLASMSLVACSSSGMGEAFNEISVGPTPTPPTVSASAPPPAVPVVKKVKPGSPVKLFIPALNVEAPVVGVKAADRSFTPPADPATMGWWADGVKPGAETGTVLIAGHTSSSGPAPLNDLETLEAGDTVQVKTTRGKVTYEVDRVRVFSKGKVFERAEKIFSQSSPGRLVLVTCEDWDGVQYRSNVVVTALPT